MNTFRRFATATALLSLALVVIVLSPPDSTDALAVTVDLLDDPGVRTTSRSHAGLYNVNLGSSLPQSSCATGDADPNLIDEIGFHKDILARDIQGPYRGGFWYYS